MKRRFNYTERRKLPRAQIAIAWIDPENSSDPASFQGSIDPTLDPPLPSEAEIHLEAYSGPVSMRFPCGTVSSPSLPENPPLTEFPPGSRPLFRVKVILPDDPQKKLLARADSIAPMSPEDAKAGRVSILPVERVDLGEQLWRLDLDDIDAPKLQLNSTVTEPRDIATMASEGDFLALAYPAVMYQILKAVISSETTEQNEHPWIRFATRMAGAHPPDSDDYGQDDQEALETENGNWIELAVSGFATHFEAKRKFVTHKLQEQSHA